MTIIKSLGFFDSIVYHIFLSFQCPIDYISKVTWLNVCRISITHFRNKERIYVNNKQRQIRRKHDKKIYLILGFHFPIVFLLMRYHSLLVVFETNQKTKNLQKGKNKMKLKFKEPTGECHCDGWMRVENGFWVVEYLRYYFPQQDKRIKDFDQLYGVISEFIELM